MGTMPGFAFNVEVDYLVSELLGKPLPKMT